MHFSIFFMKVLQLNPKTVIFVDVIAFGGMLLSMDVIERFRFTKGERITGERRIETLFARGRSFMAYPFRVVYLETEQFALSPLSVLVSIPKKRIKPAVHRNRMKRLFREAYRLNKHFFNTELLREKDHLEIAFIYVKDELCDYATVVKGVQKAMRELNNLVAGEASY